MAKLLKNAYCKDIQLEPSLLSVNNYQLPSGTILGDQARLDILLGKSILWRCQPLARYVKLISVPPRDKCNEFRAWHRQVRNLNYTIGVFNIGWDGKGGKEP